MTRIAIEATGCDGGFFTILEGAKKALEKDNSLELILVAGMDKLIEEYRTQKEINGISLEKTEYTYNPNKKNLKESSIYKTIQLHKEGEVDAVITPGDTGGTIVSSLLLKRMDYVKSLALPTHWPGNNVLIDSGASLDCEEEDLFQFAIMGNVFSKVYLGVKEPLVGLLSNGVEESKGNAVIKKSKVLIDKLREHGYNISNESFEGNWFENSGEGEPLNQNRVVVADGMLGNVNLKSAEGALRVQRRVLKGKVMNQCWYRQMCAKVGLGRVVKELSREFDYSSYAVSPLLGINGNIMVCHGKSDAETIANAIGITKKYLEKDVNSELMEETAKYKKKWFRKL